MEEEYNRYLGGLWSEYDVENQRYYKTKDAVWSESDEVSYVRYPRNNKYVTIITLGMYDYGCHTVSVAHQTAIHQSPADNLAKNKSKQNEHKQATEKLERFKKKNPPYLSLFREEIMLMWALSRYIHLSDAKDNPTPPHIRFMQYKDNKGSDDASAISTRRSEYPCYPDSTSVADIAYRAIWGRRRPATNFAEKSFDQATKDYLERKIGWPGTAEVEDDSAVWADEARKAVFAYTTAEEHVPEWLGGRGARLEMRDYGGMS